MLKLATPSQYELSIEGINLLRPLKLAEVRKIDITSPVLDVNPPNRTEPAVGKLARCSRFGSLLKTKNVFYDNYEFKAVWFDGSIPNVTFSFAQKVFQVYAYNLHSNYAASAWWSDPTYAQHYVSVPYNKTVMIPFVGQTMSFNSNAGYMDEYVIGFCGFY